MFEVKVEMGKRLNGCMCYDNKTHICTYTRNDDQLDIYVEGEVEVEFEGKTYTSFSSMPEELKEIFINETDKDDERVNVIKRNNFHAYFSDGQHSNVRVENCTKKELEEYCHEMTNIFYL